MSTPTAPPVPTPYPVAIICTLEELLDYADKKMRMFAVNISVAVNGEKQNGLPTPPDQDTLNLLQPWLWTLTANGESRPVTLYVMDTNDATKSKPITGQRTAPFPVNGSKAALTALQNRMNTELTNAVNLSGPLLSLVSWNPTDPGNNTGSQEDDQQRPVQHWPTFLSHASTYPAPLPHLLNLVYFFTINAADVQTGNLLFLAPTFSIKTSTFAPPAGTAPVQVTSTVPPQGGVNPGYVWSYDPNLKDDPPNLAVYQQGLTIKDPTVMEAGGNRINLNTLWIDIEQEDGNEDWRSTLEQRVDASFDIAQQVIDAFRNPPTGETIPASCSTTDGLDNLRFTVVSLLRDTADFGVRLAPDGFSTFQYVLDRAVRIAQQTPGQLPTGFNYQEFLSNAQQAFINAESNFNFDKFVGQLTAFPQTRGSLALQFVQTADLGALLNALDGLHSTLTDSANLAAWLFQSWDSVLSSTSFPDNVLWVLGINSLVQAQLTQLSTSLTLRKRMLQANLGGSNKSLIIWTKLTKITDVTAKERDLMRTNVSQMIQNYYHARIGDKPLEDPALNAEFAQRNPPLKPAPLPQDMLDFLSRAIQSRADDAANQAFPPDVNTTTPAVLASLTAQPVLLQVHTSKAPEPDVPDPLRSIAGVCVLARDRTNGNTGPWSCLNTGSLSINDDSPEGLLIDDFCFVPTRMANRNGLMQAVIPYNNQPLSAPSPTSAAGKDISVNASVTAKTQAPIFRFVFNPNFANLTNPATLDAWAHIVGLKYGGEVDFVAFAQRNSGALPKALADPNSPGFPLVPVAPANFVLPPETPIANVSYNRRVPVGGPRWATPDNTVTDLSKLALPKIPDTVAPIARELDPSLTEGADGKTLPLLLLWKPTLSTPTPDPSTYNFAVRPPSLYFDSWDRWARNNPVGPTRPTDNFRKALYADCLTASPKGIAKDQLTSVNNAGKPGFDASINDPAVTGLWFKLDPVPPPVPPTNGPSCVVDLNVNFTDVATAPGFGTGFAQVQDKPNSVKVTVQIGTAGSAASVTGDLKDGVVVTIPPGQVFKLSVSPVIDLASLARFDTLTEGAQFVSGTDFDANGRRVVPVQQPMQMLIEIAVGCGLSSQDLWNALTPGFDGDSITASIDRTKAPGDWRLIRRVDVTYKAWRWMGRPYLTKGFPATSFKDSLNNLDASGQPGPDLLLALKWESEAFTGRRDNNQKVSSIFYPTNVATDPTHRNDVQPVYSADLSADLRAHYYLFGATMYSRYQGLSGFQPFTTTSATSIQARLTYKDQSPTGKSFTPWKRCFVPCRIPAGTELAKPKILISVPLTTALQREGYGILSDPTYTNNPPVQPRTDLLVVANEPWHQTAGLAEQLSASIELTSNDSVGPGLPEVGPDPTLSGQAFAPDIYNTFRNATAIGTAVGATFDEATDAPLFANTCFQLRLPQNPLKTTNGKSGLPGSLDWCMAKLQLSRTVDDTMRDSQDGPSPQSKLTEGVWVQLLPSSSHFNSDQGMQSVADLVFKTQANDSVSLFDKKALSTPLELIPSVPPSGNDAGPFEIWALLMNDITDAAGQPDEIYVGLFPLTHNGTEPPASGNITGANHLYLLEVQQTQLAAAASNWRDLLFPVPDGETNADVTHRVVRMSARIEQSAQ